MSIDRALTALEAGTSHPTAGEPLGPVGEEGWATATWKAGATFTAGEGSTLRVGLYSAHATKVVLEIYGSATGADASFDYDMRKGSDGVWRAAVAQAPGKTLYAFRAWGPNWPYVATWSRGNSAAGFLSDVDASGNRFNPNKVLFDPYALELSHDVTGSALVTAGETTAMFLTGGADVAGDQTYAGPSTGNARIDRRDVDTGRYAPKSVALIDATATGTKPSLAQKDTVIYEAHVKGLTAHPSSANLAAILSGMGFPDAQNVPNTLRGTYAGAAYMAGYLKDLGYTSVELLPVHELDNDGNPATRSGGNYWGYMTYGFFAPDRHYAHDQTLGGPTREFKQMVKSFHDAGLEVYLDVVYNHTGEAGTADAARRSAQIVAFRGIDNASYYALSSSDRSAYLDTTGTGNDLDASQAPVRQLVQDSLSYWANTMGVDGFRFDLAVVLGRGGPSYAYDPNAQLLTSIASAAAAGGYKIIAEPWDTQAFPAGYQVGNFPSGWAEWNGRYRDAVRAYILGSAAGSNGLGYASAFNGDFAHFDDQGGAAKTVNLITAHDGFTLTDLVSYGTKTNGARAWPFGPSDGGADQNFSSDWGLNQQLRRQVIRNLLAFQLMSRGVPMTVWGDELGRTQNGNNNPFNVDSVATWNNYDMIASATPDSVPTGDATGGNEGYHNDLGTYDGGRNQNFLFLRCMLELRKAHPALRQGDYAMPVTFTRPDGSGGFNELSDLATRIYLSGSAIGDSDFLVMSNMQGSMVGFAVPNPPNGAHWVRVADTHSWAENQANCWDASAGTTIGGGYGVNGRSIVVLQAVGAAPPSLSSNANLSVVSVSAGSLIPGFSSGTTSYSVSVTNAVSSTTVSAAAQDAGAALGYRVVGTSDDFTPLPNNTPSASIPLAVGSTTIQVRVTAADRSFKDYTIGISRRAAGNSDAALSVLDLSSVVLSPSFSPTTGSYTSSVANGVGSTTLTAMAHDSGAIVQYRLNGGMFSAPLFGSLSAMINLPVGLSTLEIQVKATDLTTRQSYLVAVTRAAPPSSNAALSGLSFAGLELTPAFASGITTYAGTAPAGVASTTLTATAAQAGARLQLQLNGATSPLASGVATPVPLNVGANTVGVLVIAEDDSTTRTYVTTVTRPAPSAVPNGTLRIVLKAAGNNESVKFPGDQNGWNIDTSQAIGAGSNTTVTLDLPGAVTASAIGQGDSGSSLELQVVNAGRSWDGSWDFSAWKKVGCTVSNGKQVNVAATDQDVVTFTIDVTTTTLTAVVEAR
jgi:glycogen operon protein